jgi:hypothetical protein
VEAQRALDDLDGAVDAGAETSGIGEQDLHGRIISQTPSDPLTLTLSPEIGGEGFYFDTGS